MADQTLDDAAATMSAGSTMSSRGLTAALIPPMTPTLRNEALDGDGTNSAYTSSRVSGLCCGP